MHGSCRQRSDRLATTSRSSSLALVCVSLALLLQCLAPPGYMAGSLEDGWPVVLCPEGLPAGYLGHDQHHHHDADGTGSTHDLSLDGHCPLGSMFDASAAALALSTSDKVEQSGFNDTSGYPPPLLKRSYPAHRSRAPPVPV